MPLLLWIYLQVSVVFIRLCIVWELIAFLQVNGINMHVYPMRQIIKI